MIADAQRVEHYEIAGYGTVRAFAKLLEDVEAEELLTTTFDEESATAVAWFEKVLSTDPRDFQELRGKNLACWCEKECVASHADYRVICELQSGGCKI